MKRSLYGPADPFTISPMLSLLPVQGRIGRLEALTSSLYARFEKVKSLQKDSSADGQQRRFVAESLMLKQVLDWLSLQPEGGANDNTEV